MLHVPQVVPGVSPVTLLITHVIWAVHPQYQVVVC